MAATLGSDKKKTKVEARAEMLLERKPCPALPALMFAFTWNYQCVYSCLAPVDSQLVETPCTSGIHGVLLERSHRFRFW